MIPDALLAHSDPHPGGYRELAPLPAHRHLADLRLIDVREPDEFVGPLGHVPVAELVPLGTLEAAAATWDRDAALLVMCRSGARSSRAAASLVRMGFRAVFNLSGGMIGWEGNGLPTEYAAPPKAG